MAYRKRSFRRGSSRKRSFRRSSRRRTRKSFYRSRIGRRM